MAYDEIWQMPDGGVAFVRLEGRPPRCRCGQRATLQCDFPNPRRGTCDKHLCRACAVSAGPNRDFCPNHPREQREMSL